MKISRLPEFEKDIKKLLKKYRTLEGDLETFIKNQLCLYHEKKIDNGGIKKIPDLKISSPKIYKAKKFSCRALKGYGAHSGIRLIYAYYEEQSEDRIELIEIYHKNEKENMNRERILKYYANKNKWRNL